MTKKPQVLSTSPALTPAQEAIFDTVLASFLIGAQAIIKNNSLYKDYRENGGKLDLPLPKLEIRGGNRYIAIDSHSTQKMIHVFVDRTTGDVLKPATYKAPAKHARGNIFDASNGLSKMGVFGPAYLK